MLEEAKGHSIYDHVLVGSGDYNVVRATQDKHLGKEHFEEERSHQPIGLSRPDTSHEVLSSSSSV